MADKIKLKPRPFCGAEAEVEMTNIEFGNDWSVYCHRCRCGGAFCDTEAEAAAAWNRRANNG